MLKDRKNREIARLCASTPVVEKEGSFPAKFVEECFSTSCSEGIHRKVWKKGIQGVIVLRSFGPGNAPYRSAAGRGRGPGRSLLPLRGNSPSPALR